jgi:hypothetical protein
MLGERARAEYPIDLSRGMRLNLSELAFEVLAAYDIALHWAVDLFICMHCGI